MRLDPRNPSTRHCPPARCAWLTALALLFASPGHAAPGTCLTNVVHRGEGPPRTLESWTGAGESLLLAGEGAELVIYNAANPSAPVRLGAIGLSGPAAHIAISPNGALVAVSDRRNSISLVSIVNRAAPALRSRYDVPEGRIPRGLAINGNLLYAAISPAGPAAIDISNPAAPVLLHQAITPGTDFVFDIKLSPSGTLAYVADDNEGVTVWNVNNPGNLQQVASYPSIGASHLLISGNRAYVARRQLGYDILNIANTTPTLLGTVGVAGSYSHGALVNGHLVTAAGSAGLRTFNIATPANPQLVSTVSDQTNVDGVAGLSNSAWVPMRLASGNGIRAYGLGNPSAPVVQSNLPSGAASARVHASGGRVYVPQFPRGLAIFDNQESTRGALLGRYDTASINVVTTSGNVAYVASSLNDEYTLRVLNVANPANVVQLTTRPLPTSAYQMSVLSNRLYLATPSGLRTYNISTPGAPVFLSEYGVGFTAVLAAGNRIYVGKFNGIEVLDASTSPPTLIGQLQTGEPVIDMAQQGDFLYLADGNALVRVLNISNPASISQVASMDLAPGLAFGLALDGPRLYVASGPYWGTVVGSIATPTAPVQIGNLSTPDSVIDVAFDNGALIAAEGDNGVRFHGCSDSAFANGFEQ